MDLKYVASSFLLFINLIAAQKVEKDAKIMNGTQVPLHIPWVAAIYLPGDTLDDSPSCGGSIVGPRFILTAAHCVYKDPKESEECSSDYQKQLLPASEIQVVVGQSNLLIKEKLVFSVERIIPHPNFDQCLLVNDLALLELKRPIEFKFLLTNSIGISEKRIPEGQKAVVTGWGYTCLPSNEDFYKRMKLNFINVVVFNNSQCGPYEMLVDTLICAGSKQGSVQKGDSGSGLFIFENWKPQLIGIVSYRHKLCTFDNSVFTRLSEFRKWISQNIYKNNNNNGD